jgi:FAD synthetase
VGGTFDILHPGHIFLLKEASKHGDVIVVVARDSTVKRIKGREPIFNEEHRLMMVSSIKYVKKAILGKESTDILEIVEELKPDVIVVPFELSIPT